MLGYFVYWLIGLFVVGSSAKIKDFTCFAVFLLSSKRSPAKYISIGIDYVRLLQAK
jgi:hypothetical protein